MRVRKHGRPIVLLAVPLALLVSLICFSRGAPDKNAVDGSFANLPPQWAVVESFFVSPDQVNAIQQKLGGRIERLSNTVLSVHGQRIQVNLIDCPTENDAIKVHRVVSAMKGHPAFCLRRDKRVIEFVGNSVQLAVKTSLELGFVSKPAEARFRVSAKLVPLDDCDYMSFNELFNLPCEYGMRPGMRRRSHGFESCPNTSVSEDRYNSGRRRRTARNRSTASSPNPSESMRLLTARP